MHQVSYRLLSFFPQPNTQHLMAVIEIGLYPFSSYFDRGSNVAGPLIDLHPSFLATNIPTCKRFSLLSRSLRREQGGGAVPDLAQ